MTHSIWHRAVSLSATSECSSMIQNKFIKSQQMRHPSGTIKTLVHPEGSTSREAYLCSRGDNQGQRPSHEKVMRLRPIDPRTVRGRWERELWSQTLSPSNIYHPSRALGKQIQRREASAHRGVHYIYGWRMTIYVQCHSGHYQLSGVSYAADQEARVIPTLLSRLAKGSHLDRSTGRHTYRLVATRRSVVPNAMMFRRSIIVNVEQIWNAL